MRSLRITSLALAAVASIAGAFAQQNTGRVLPTVTEMLLIPPARLASTTVGESTNWLAWVQTTGDTSPGTGTRYWRWDEASTEPTNTLANAGPLAWPGRPHQGRWYSVGAVLKGATASRVMGTDGAGVPVATSTPTSALSLLDGGTAPFEARIVALQAGLATKVSAGDLPVNVTDFVGVDFTDTNDDTDGINAAVLFAKTFGRELNFPDGLCRVRPDGVNLEDVTLRCGATIFESTAHPTGNFGGADLVWGLFNITGKVVIYGNGFTVFNGRRDDGTYSTSETYRLAALKSNGGSSLIVDGCIFRDWVHQSIYLRNMDVAEIRNNIFDDTHQDLRTFRVKRLYVHHNTFLNKRFITTGVSASANNLDGADVMAYENNYHGLAYSSVPQASEVYASWCQFFTCFGARVTGNYFEGFTADTTTANINVMAYDSSWGYVGQNILASQHNATTFILLEGTCNAVVDANVGAGRKTKYMPFAYASTRSRSGNLVTVTTTTPHGFTTGMQLTVSGFSDATYNGSVTVANILSATVFTYTLNGTDLGTTADAGGLINCARTYTGFGIYAIEANIVGNYRFPGALEWREPGSQLRSRTEAMGLMLRANILLGFHTGIWVGASDTDIVENRITGSELTALRLGARLTSWPGLNTLNPTIHRCRNIRVLNNYLSYNRGNAIRLAAVFGLEVRGNTCAGNENDAITMDMPSSNSGTVLAGTTTTSINISTSLGTSDRSFYSVYFPDTDQVAYIKSNTSGNLVPMTALAVAPSTGHRYVISYGVGDNYEFIKNRFFDEASIEGMNGIVSYNPTQQIGPGGTNFFAIETRERQLFQVGRRFTLVGALDTAANLTARVAWVDPVFADRVWCEPTSPTAGTFRTTAGGPVKSGTGTVSFTDGASPPLQWESRSLLTGSGTLFSEQLDNSRWIGVAGNWGMIGYVESNTAARMPAGYRTSFSGQSFLYVLADVTFVPVQNSAFKIFDTPARCNFDDNLTFGNTDATPYSIDLATAPNALPKLAGATPTIGRYKFYRLANTTSTTITALPGATPGYSCVIQGDGFTTFDLSGTTLKGNAGSDKAVSVNAYAHIFVGNGTVSVVVAESP
ncbi:MAG: hypothetical protein J0L84_00380 [Verrucomicrobia bacterium]|nr:hypothetical protein [Verrucomicrobiota bacterium]